MRLRRGEVEQAGRCSPQAKSGSKEPLTELVATFSSVKLGEENGAPTRESKQARRFRTRYQRLQVHGTTATGALARIQQSSLQVLESWLPTTHKAQENPQLSCKITVRPMEQLLQQWGLEAIAPVGAELSYDPQLHQLLGRAQPGERVKVRYTGYCQGDKLLYRAKVSPI